MFRWQYLVVSLLAACLGTFVIVNTTRFSWNHIDQNDEETIFAPFTCRKGSSKWRNYITNQPINLGNTHPKLYYPRNCPHFQQHLKSCAKPVPSFIFAGSEFAGASYVFRMLKKHPQVAEASVDNSVPHNHVFVKDEFDDANAFDSYISQFPFLKDDMLATMEEKMNWIVGENAPHYLYHSHLAAKRIKDTLPHVKLVFFLREPIARAYSQYLYEKSEVNNSKLTFEALIDLELPILRRCGHTSTQTGWEGFVTCHQGSEIRASWKVSNDTHAFNSLAKGMYYPALVPFLQQFPSSQLFIIRTEDILLNPSGSFQQLAKFLDIDPTFFAERNFYQDEHLTEAELISTPPENAIGKDDIKNENHRSNVFIQTSRPPRLQVNNDHRDNHLFFSSNNDEPKLSTRYRLQRVFRDLNYRLLEIFDNSKTYFNGWIYDVDRG
ncbi:P-loop containing nucleoside triphosphate hydrolase protein [Mucor mucedo]|uniref:P-loop containing nucleoside triphosphate hydrolase protein n=1 Tax=Mucor mucedo TaxID=29922 RepID=UPI002220EC59|nr:P-loop containing nucleoside triphosphate hydrolase protein [Mucor mucedo]KAI7888470.1 P-loop containing nucleoside triphosphate hydrolase protein [Mucor mucedo]